uniref:DDE Tnp4 domain-containing protein n=1 Tax=Brassica oleracea var. oleracea TaxID=109376 RepID=A0A0D3CV56_BRAOL
MNKPLFMHIVDRLSNEVQFFRQKNDGLGRLGFSAFQKCTTAIRVLAYGTAADAVDEYLRIGETTTRACVEKIVEGIINLFGDEYLRKPTPADLQRLLDIGEYRRFPGMIGSIDCMHWEWKNCPTAWKGQYSCSSGKPTIVLEAVASYDLWICHAFFGPPEFLQGEDTGSSHVDLDFSQDMPTDIANMMDGRTKIRDRQMHQQLKADLVEYI